MESDRRFIPNDANSKQCRICLATLTQSLISPCLCKGTTESMHLTCLNYFIQHKYRSLADDDDLKEDKIVHCQICKHQYVGLTLCYQERKLRMDQINGNPKRKRRFWTFVMANFLIVMAMATGWVIFLQNEGLIMGIIWYSFLGLLFILVWCCLYKAFVDSMYVTEPSLKKSRNKPLQINPHPSQKRQQQVNTIKQRLNI